MSENNEFTFENPQYRKTYWHTCSHVMAQAVKRLWPEVKLAIGPSIDNGFYYDFDAPFNFTQENLDAIEAEMKKISAEYANGGITVVAKGDMTIDKIAITPEAYEEVKAGKPARFETMLFNVVNGALKKARETTQQEMAKLMQANGGFGGLFGK